MNLRHAILPLALALSLPAVADAARGFEVRDMAYMDRHSSPTLSPDGRVLVFAKRVVDKATHKSSTSLWTRNLLTRDMRPPSRLTPEGWNVNSPSFSADGKTVYFMSGKSGSMQLYSLPIAGGEPTRLTDYALDVDAYKFSPDGKQVAMSVRQAIREEPWSTNFDLWLVNADGSGARNLTAKNPAWDAGPVFSADGKTLYYRAMARPGFEADRFALMAMDLASGSTREIASKWDASADGITLSADGKWIYTTAGELGRHPLFRVSLANGEVENVVKDGSVSSFDLAGSTLAISRNSMKSGDVIYTSSADGKAPLRAITPSAGEMLPDVAWGEYEQFNFIGWNNETVHGYVVKPWNYVAGKKYPVAFLIHGGPQGSFGDGWSYRWNPQTYAGQGYAVVMIDFHGSTGYGQKFTDSISGHWGDRPLEDLQKGWAAAQKKYAFLDGDKACALGASYGGFMVNWIAGNWQQPWKCLVSHDGVFDQRAMGYATEELWFTEWEQGGTPYDVPKNYEQFNPVNHVKEWSVPMLVIHGQLDYRIPAEQGIAVFTALQRRGIESKFLYFPDENHWVLKPQNSVQWHDTVNGWLKQHIGQ